MLKPVKDSDILISVLEGFFFQDAETIAMQHGFRLVVEVIDGKPATLPPSTQGNVLFCAVVRGKIVALNTSAHVCKEIGA